MPSRLLEKLAERLHPAEEDEAARFVSALADPGLSASFAPCAIFTSGHVPVLPGGIVSSSDSLPWLPDFVLRFLPGTRVGQLEAHAEGHLYSLDFSSVFAASALLVIDSAPRILDVCAAPGGKSIFASRALAPGLLVANEVVGKRIGMLRGNLSRCGIPNAFTQRLDPSELAAVAPAFFDLVLVDAPCSGQSLLVKGIENPGCFHPSTVNRNVKRQRRILGESAATVAPGGHLFYSTCTFSPEENEKVIGWLLKRHGEGFRPRLIPHLEEWRSPHADFPCYRLHPQEGLGAGAFACLLRRDEAGKRNEEPVADLVRFPAGRGS